MNGRCDSIFGIGDFSEIAEVFRLRQREGEEGVALFGAEFAVAACSDDEILFAV